MFLPSRRPSADASFSASLTCAQRLAIPPPLIGSFQRPQSFHLPAWQVRDRGVFPGCAARGWDKCRLLALPRPPGMSAVGGNADMPAPASRWAVALPPGARLTLLCSTLNFSQLGPTIFSIPLNREFHRYAIESIHLMATAICGLQLNCMQFPVFSRLSGNWRRRLVGIRLLSPPRSSGERHFPPESGKARLGNVGGYACAKRRA